MVLNYKIVGSTVTAFALFAILIWCAQSTSVSPDEKELVLHISVMVVGVTLGWIIGILTTPYGEKEKEHFSTIVKGVTVFFSGYALAKIDPIISTLLKPETFLEPIVAFRAIAFLTSLLLAVIITFVYRKYAR